MIDNLVQHYGYLALALVIFIECIGVPLPGETALIAAAVYAGTTHQLHPVWVAAAAGAAAISGDNVGYLLGRRYGAAVVRRTKCRFPRLASYLQICTRLFDRHGVKVVFFGRFVGVLRTWSAFFAGLYAMRWRSFFGANVSGGVLWAGAWTAAAYLLGDTAARFGHWATIAGIALALGLSVALAVGAEKRLRADPGRPEQVAVGNAQR